MDLFADLEGSFKPFFADWYLVFAHDGKLFTIRPDGTDQREIPDAPQGVSFATYSPDGSQLAFFLFSGGDRGLYLMPADGGPAEEIINITEVLGNNIGYSFNMPWSPSGHFVALNFFLGNQGELFAADLLGGTLINLTQTPEHSEFGAHWAPDGEHLVFASSSSEDGEIYLVGLDGFPPENLTNHPATDWSPRFSPDGQRISFGYRIDDEADVYVMDADGQNPVNITFSPGDDWAISWSPR